MKFLRALVIILLFSILGMQIYFLVTKKTVKTINKPVIVESAVSVQTDTMQQVIPETTKANKATPAPKAIVKKATINQSKVVYKVNPAKCIGCTLCVSSCPVNAITMVNGVAVIDETKCIGCGICKNGDNADFAGCPVSAISIK